MLFQSLLFIPLLLLHYCEGSSEEFRLLQDLRDGYDTIERPVEDHSKAIKVKLRVLLQQIIDVDEKNQALTLVVWNQLTWNDYKLKWNASEYGGIDDIQVPRKFIWRPDVLLFNSANENFETGFAVNSGISSNGDVINAPPGVAKISCQMTMTWFPFDHQVCFLKYGSWTYNGNQLDLDFDSAGLTEDMGIDLKYFLGSEEFEIVKAPATRIVKEFVGEKYIELYFHLHIKRKSLYYSVTWVLPAVLISMSNILQFTMPTAGGEKITLQTTNVLATLVFLSQTSNATPPTSDSIPILSAFFSASLCIMGASTISTLLIMNVHFRDPALREMGSWTRWVFLETLPKYLLMDHNYTPPISQSKRFDSELFCSVSEATKTVEKINQMTKVLNPRLSLSFEDFEVYTRLDNDVRNILEILHVFDEKLENDQLDRIAQLDWQFMAYVLDRFCLFMYATLVFIVLSCLLLFPRNH